MVPRGGEALLEILVREMLRFIDFRYVLGVSGMKEKDACLLIPCVGQKGRLTVELEEVPESVVSSER